MKLTIRFTGLDPKIKDFLEKSFSDYGVRTITIGASTIFKGEVSAEQVSNIVNMISFLHHDEFSLRQ